MSSDPQGGPEQSREERQRRQREEILRFLLAIFEPGDVAELRVLRWGAYSKTVSGYFGFDHLEQLAEEAIARSPAAGGVYVIANRIDPALLARRANVSGVVGRDEPLTGDHEVRGRRWILLDFDPVRPSGIASTNDEHDSAIAAAHAVRHALVEEGWPEPILLDTGNGAALFFKIHLPPDDGGLVKRILEALALRFNDDLVEIDTSVHNPARLVRLPGTLNRKGSHIKERPHRYARILDLPERIDIVSQDLLEALASEAPVEEKPAVRGPAGLGLFDIERWIVDHNLSVDGPQPWQGGRKWIFPVCPWKPEHTNRSAYLIQFSNGAIAASCHHSACSGKRWHDLRDVVEPGWREARSVPAAPRAGGDDGAGKCHEAPWPEPLVEEAFPGLTGEVVRLIEPHTEADPVALLINLLVAFGNLIGDKPHFLVEADRHPARLYAVLVGKTSKGRKGTSWGQVRRLLESLDPTWAGGKDRRVKSGLASGEGLVWQVRDPIFKAVYDKKTKTAEEACVDEGVSDKRLMVVEPEFASVLKILVREGNTLSPVVRDAWDRGDLSSLSKNSPGQATGAHVSMIGHITRDELRRRLDETEAGNGFGNRILWICVKRSKCLPDGGRLDEVDFAPTLTRLRAAFEFARGAGKFRRDEEAREIWANVYPELSEGLPGLLGAVTGRAEAQVTRLSVLYALLDCSPVVRKEHLLAALAIWDYAFASARYVFGDMIGDSTADAVLEALRREPKGMSRAAINSLFSGHKKSEEISRALTLLHRLGKAQVIRVRTAGRPEETWFAVSEEGKGAEKAEEAEEGHEA